MAILTGSPDGQQILFRDEGKRLQVSICGPSFPNDGQLVLEAIVPPCELQTRIRLWSCFNDLIVSGRLTRRYFRPEPRGARLRRVLQVLDGFLAAAPHRDIAAALHGSSRVNGDWASPGEHLRDAVRRAVHRGRELMNGGYRRLLR